MVQDIGYTIGYTVIACAAFAGVVLFVSSVVVSWHGATFHR
jgi:hypothetical protein